MARQVRGARSTLDLEYPRRRKSESTLAYFVRLRAWADRNGVDFVRVEPNRDGPVTRYRYGRVSAPGEDKTGRKIRVKRRAKVYRNAEQIAENTPEVRHE